MPGVGGVPGLVPGVGGVPGLVPGVGGVPGVAGDCSQEPRPHYLALPGAWGLVAEGSSLLYLQELGRRRQQRQQQRQLSTVRAAQCKELPSSSLGTPADPLHPGHSGYSQTGASPLGITPDGSLWGSIRDGLCPVQLPAAASGLASSSGQDLLPLWGFCRLLHGGELMRLNSCL